jgi:hypothetical protein
MPGSHDSGQSEGHNGHTGARIVEKDRDRREELTLELQVPHGAPLRWRVNRATLGLVDRPIEEGASARGRSSPLMDLTKIFSCNGRHA